MAEFMTGLKRTDYCSDLRIGDVGREVTVCGWVQRCRDLGQLILLTFVTAQALFSLHLTIRRIKKFLIKLLLAAVSMFWRQKA